MTDQALMRSFESLTNKRVMGLLAVVVLVVLGLIVVIAGGFRGVDVSKGANAMTTPPATVTQPQSTQLRK
jgi:uncharacterized membrane protein